MRADDPADGLVDLPHRENRPSGASREWTFDVGGTALTPDPKLFLSDGGFWQTGCLATLQEIFIPKLASLKPIILRQKSEG